ncbi:hypothetical protein A2773_01320 [Candidatus Gottesmanbacteria bacterium RIFCSPHIGHO2_01_FULL_39_10]|uniref:Uncharacterized protein n=1 Tax=Candidatus Gottesmanbacteria bacterium RIFCSPHIGHO2_01_FULL_39_10 TaxID=1798375 RepID=A0A1F5ZR47_9BACT|nr:MAG: hypothetical protein A2773_01320 [Candidatus Gottesmanbacteria bacterium RIFCSPHIGHO2_01_FULL_39_10]
MIKKIVIFFFFLLLFGPEKTHAAGIKCDWAVDPPGYIGEKDSLTHIPSSLDKGGIDKITISPIINSNDLVQFIHNLAFNENTKPAEIIMKVSCPSCDPIFKYAIKDYANPLGDDFSRWLSQEFHQSDDPFYHYKSLVSPSTHYIWLYYRVYKDGIRADWNSTEYPICEEPLTYVIDPKPDAASCDVYVHHGENTKGDTTDTTWKITASNIRGGKKNGNRVRITDFIVKLDNEQYGGRYYMDEDKNPVFNIPIQLGKFLSAKLHTVSIDAHNNYYGYSFSPLCENVYNVLSYGEPTPTNTPIPSPTQIPTPMSEPNYCNNNKPGLCGTPTYKCDQKDADGNECQECIRCKMLISPTAPPDFGAICKQVSKDADTLDKCLKCVNPPAKPSDQTPPNPPGESGIWTAIGCIPTDPVRIINEKILGAAGLGIAGGIAFLYFLFGAFKVLTSMGNAEAINEGKEIMVSSISGILLIIFSVLILQIIGVDLIKIPGFSAGPTPIPTS